MADYLLAAPHAHADDRTVQYFTSLQHARAHGHLYGPYPTLPGVKQVDHTKRVSGRAPRHKKRAGPIAPGEAVAAPSRKQRQRPDLVRCVSGGEIAIREVPDSCILLFSKEVNTEISHSDISDIRIIRIPTSGAVRNGVISGQKRVSKDCKRAHYLWDRSLGSGRRV